MAGKFLNVKCKCGEERTIYSNSTTTISCTSCKEKLLANTGGKAVVLGELIEDN